VWGVTVLKNALEEQRTMLSDLHSTFVDFVTSIPAKVITDQQTDKIEGLQTLIKAIDSQAAFCITSLDSLGIAPAPVPDVLAPVKVADGDPVPDVLG
jgi:peroxiredoxin family protein